MFSYEEDTVVLIVEDNPINLKVLNSIVEKKYIVLTAKDGEEAYEVIKNNHIDLILLDVMLPKMDGFTLCKLLKDSKEYNDIPIIFVTSLNDQDSELEGLQIGGVDFITKPYSAPIVLARVDTQIKLQQQARKLNELANIDQLTNIYNRRGFEENIKNLWSKAVKKKSLITIMMIDADYFKQYNDSYGHVEGDECIKSIAIAIKKSIDVKVDLLARYGGEEFVVVTISDNIDHTKSMAEAIKKSVYNLNIEHKSSSISDRVTVSIGVVSSYTKDIAGYAQLVISADEALYEAKKSGRDKIVYS
jgi:diguanylate cyclase (GGDEF)-like protein